MLASQLSIVSSLALVAMSSPLTAPPRGDTATGPWCHGFGTSGFDVAYNFTLAARNRTDGPSSSNAVASLSAGGTPLVLSAADGTSGAETSVLSTYESYPSGSYSSFSLVNGTLQASGSRSRDGPIVSAVNANVTAGTMVTFTTTNRPGDSSSQYPIYCGVADTDPDGGAGPKLAVLGDTDSFALCEASTQSSPNAMVSIVYKPNEGTQRQYSYATCYAVDLFLGGLY